MTKHCGYLLCLIVALWAELVAGNPTSTARPRPTDKHVQSVIEDLQESLEMFSSLLNNTSLVNILEMPSCNETPLEQWDTSLAAQLLAYQKCAQLLHTFNPEDETFCTKVVKMNETLMQHLNAKDFLGCPPSSPRPSDLQSVQESLRCLQCWRQQMKALK